MIFVINPCDGRRCPAYKQPECGPKRGFPSLLCHACHRKFYNETCLLYHLTKGVCQTLKRCPDCCKQFNSTEEKETNQCHYDKCRICKKTVHLLDHQCFIQQVKPEEGMKKKKAKKQTQHHRQVNPNASIRF